MYETFVGINMRPFAAVPVVEGYFAGTVCENARAALSRCIERGEGIGILVGPVGTGKTLLCQKLAEQFKSNFCVVLLTSGRLSSRRSLFQAILYELGQPYRSMDEGELRLALVDFLTSGKEQGRAMLLIVDEAHTLPLRLLDEIRMLTNLSRGGQPLVRVVLSGSGALEERLAHPKLDSFNSRIATRCYLEAFNRTETAEYLRAKIDLTGGNGEEVFSDDACQSVYRATQGVPRLINQLCDHALLGAFSVGQRRLEAEHVEEAWADLQQLPTPWNGDSQGDKPGVIEFGRLDDMPEAESESIKMPTPPLKLNSEVNALELEPALQSEPIEQLDSIAELLDGVTDEVEVCDSMRPEIDLSFDEFEHPFAEPFEQEELVCDRYATASSPVSVLQTVVPVFQFGTFEESLAGREKFPKSKWEENPTVQEVVPDYQLKNSPLLQGNVAELRFEKARDIQERVLQRASETLVLPRSTGQAEIKPKKDQPVLMVEEDKMVEAKNPLSTSRAVQPVRRSEYNRLFAKLRRQS